MLTKTTNMTFAPPIPLILANQDSYFARCSPWEGITCACSQDAGQGAWESTVFITTEEKELSCSWSIRSRCHFVIHTKALCAEWPEDCRVTAVFPSHLPPMLPSNKFYSPYVYRLYRKCSQKYILNFLGIDNGICIQHSDVNSRSSPTFFQFRRQSPIRIA